MWLLFIGVAIPTLAAGVIYNLFFHPLSGIPGPFLARITPVWLAWQCKHNRRPRLDLELHKKYGSVVRISPNEIIFSNPAHFKTVYGAGSTRAWGRSRFLTGHNQHQHDYNRLNMLLESDMDKLRIQRRMVGPVYSMANARKHESLVNNNDRQWAARLKSLIGQVLDLYSELELLSVDLYCEMTFGEAYGAVDEGSDGGQQESMAKRWSWIGWVGFLPWLCTLQHELMKRNVPFSQFKIPFPVSAWAAGKMAQYASLTSDAEEKTVDKAVSLSEKPGSDEKIEATNAHTMSHTVSATAAPVVLESKDTITPCLLDDLSIAGKMKAGFGKSWAVDMAMTNIGAGIDTTSWTLATVIYEVCANPQVYSNLRTEIDGALGSGLIKKDTPVPYEVAGNLPYLQACMNEAMRLWPNVAVSLARNVPREGIEIDGHYIPQGHVVGMNSRQLGRSEEVFGADTESFVPERWLKASRERFNEMESRNLGFGGPSRKCPGRNVAWVAMSKLLAGLFANFDVEVLNELDGAPGPGGRSWVEIGSFPTKWEGMEARVKQR